ncbi:MAG TPA: YoaK family protein [Anaeromyxobacteraceae bacterium]
MDGLGYVLLDRLFTAHITGNTVKAGTDLAQLDVSRALVDSFPIAVFVLGGFTGALLRDLLARWVSRPRISVLATSAALLVAFAAAGALLEAGRAPPPGGISFYVLAALATASMGVQNAAKPLFAGRPVRTFMTGTMIDFGEALAASAMAAGGARRERLHHAGLLFTVWLAYLVGGAAAGAAALHLGTVAALLPACGVVTALAVEWRAR